MFAMTKESKCRLLLMAALAAAVAGCVAKSKNTTPAPTTVAPPPPDFAADVRRAELWGSALYDSYRSEKPPESATGATAIQTTRASVKDDCAPTYRTIVVSPPGAPTDRIFLYHIGEVPPAQGMMLGRHYRIETSTDGKGILLGEPSMPTCLILPPAADATAEAHLTHTQSRAPDEFDVFLSLRYGRALLVATDAGSWRVENGKITFLGRS